MKYFIFIIIFFASKTLVAFNFKECQKKFYNPNKEGILKTRDILQTGPFSISSGTTTTTIYVSDFASSTSQFISNKGNCKAYDFKRAKIINFLDANLERLRIEYAQGSGENINAFNTLLECEDKKLIDVIKINYKSIFFLEDKPSNVEFVAEAIKKSAEINQINIHICKNLDLL